MSEKTRQAFVIEESLDERMRKVLDAPKLGGGTPSALYLTDRVWLELDICRRRIDGERVPVRLRLRLIGMRIRDTWDRFWWSEL